MKKLIIKGPVLLILAATIILCIKNLKNPEFYFISAGEGLTLIIAVLLAFWATNYINKQDKQKNHVERLVVQIQCTVIEESFYKISLESDVKKMNIGNRKISNAVNVLKTYSTMFDFEEEIKYIEKEFAEYKRFTGEKISDLDYLSKSENTLIKYAENINSKCDQVILKLYK